MRGRPVHETEIGRDPKTPVRESHLVSLLQTQSRRTAAVVTLETVECGPRAIRDQVEAHLRRGAALLVCDAEDDTALRTIAASCVDRPDTLWVGSAGLADHLADALAPPTSTTRVADLDGPDGPVLLVAGSVSQTTRQQVEAVRALQRSVTVELNPAAGKAFEAALAAEQSKLRGETLWYRMVVGGNTPRYVRPEGYPRVPADPPAP